MPTTDPPEPDDADPPEIPDPYVDLKARLSFAALIAISAWAAASHLNLEGAAVRKLALERGRPATALVSSKRTYAGRNPENLLELNYQYSPDYAPRPAVRVNDAAYAAIALNTHVPIHFVPGCSSCVALDQDYGSDDPNWFWGAFVALLIVGACAFDFFRTLWRMFLLSREIAARPGAVPPA